MRACVLFVLALILCGLALPASAERMDSRAVAEEIVRRGDAAVAAYTPTEGLAASHVFSRLYFGVFESSGFEFRLGSVDAALLMDVEKRFGRLVRMCAQGAPRTEVEAGWSELRAGVKEAAEVVASSEDFEDTYRVALQSLAVLLRASLAPTLVLAALVTALRRGGAGDKGRLALSAFAAGLFGGLAVGAVFRGDAGLRTGLAGASLLAAAVSVTVLSCWVIVHRRIAQGDNHLNALLGVAVGPPLLVALASAIFLPTFWAAVQAFLFVAVDTGEDGDRQPLAVAGMVAALCLAALYGVARRLSLHLALRWALWGAAMLLVVASVLLVGDGVQALQTTAFMSSHELPSLSMLGLVTTVESVTAQVFVVVIVGMTWFHQCRQRASATSVRRAVRRKS